MGKRIAICFSSVPFIRGGAELCAESLKAELTSRGFNADIVSIPFQWDPRPELLKNILMWRLLNIERVAGSPVDLVIGTKFPSYMVKHPNKVAWLFHQHRAVYDLYGTQYSDFDPKSPEDLKVRSKIIGADNVSLGECRGLYSIARNTSDRLKRFNNLESTPIYHPPKLRGRYYCDRYGDYILSVGRLEGLKRVDLLLQALAYTERGVKCIIAGTGGLEGYLKQTANDLGLKDRVRFAGQVSDEELLKLYAGCFATYFAPFDEDYGYITLESFLSKKPVITCRDSGGVLEFARHDVNAKVADSPEPKAFGSYINELYNDTAKCKRLGEAGYSAVKDISWDSVIKRLTATI